MSNIFKTKEVIYIDDCRELNYAECMGLVLNGIIFNKFDVKGGYNVNYHHFKNALIDTYIDKYTFHCDPEQKSIIIELHDNYHNYRIYIIPMYNYITIIIKYDNDKIAYLDYSIEELEDIL